MATTAAVDVDAAVRFLKTLFGPAAPGFIGLWTLQTKESYWYKADLPDECARGVARFAPDSDLYVHLGLQAKPTRPIERGKETGVIAVPGLWLDLDYADAVHKKPNLPPNEAAARRFLGELPFPPTLVIHSGHGLQAYWLWRELWVFDDAAEHDQAAALGKRWTRFCREQAQRQGWDVDSTHDLARIFRIPGTLNHKDKGSPPRLVEVVTESEARYNPSDFEEFLPAYVADSATNGSAAAVGEFVIESGNPPPLEKFAAAMSGAKFRKSWTRTRSDLQDQSGSGYDASLATMAHMMGWTAQETVDLLCEAARKHGGQIKGRSYYEHTLAMAGGAAVIVPSSEDPEPVASVEELATDESRYPNVIDGRTFVFGGSGVIEAIWGRDEEVLWSKGESLIVVGPSGVGKSTLVDQVVLARLGLRDSVLGFPVAPSSSKLMLFAMDRPPQIARSLFRMVREATDGATLADKLMVWPGPLMNALDKPEDIVNMCLYFGVDTACIDSLKDIHPDVTRPEVGGKINALVQLLLKAGIEVIIVHHIRKAQAENKKPTKLDDAYGAGPITWGAGSVILLWGEAGDLIVEFKHLKQPSIEVGPFKVQHDHAAGISWVSGEVDVLRLIRAARQGLTVQAIARAMYGTDKSDEKQDAKARRKLQALRDRGLAVEVEGRPGGTGGAAPSLWFAVDSRTEEAEGAPSRAPSHPTVVPSGDPSSPSMQVQQGTFGAPSPPYVPSTDLPPYVVGESVEACTRCETDPVTVDPVTEKPVCAEHAPKDAAWWT